MELIGTERKRKLKKDTVILYLISRLLNESEEKNLLKDKRESCKETNH